MRKNFFRLGPGILITAAFIGPGTLTVCTIVGVNSGMLLLWAILFSVIITIISQNIVAKISWETKKGLAQVLLEHSKTPLKKWSLIILLISAIFFGNSAYEAGNITGAKIGLQQIIESKFFDLTGFDILPLIICFLISAIYLMGGSEIIKKILLVIVVLMSFSFIFAAIITKPDLLSILNGLFIPRFNANQLTLLLSVIGTTIVPYNLFLHSALVKNMSSVTDFKQIRMDTIISVSIGGLISLCIVMVAANSGLKSVESVSDLGISLSPIYGELSEYLISIGLFGAGLSSAITAPLAASYVVSECFDWKQRENRSKYIFLFVLITGTIFSSLDLNPIVIIQLAQIFNGLLLPIIGLFLLLLVTSNKLKGYFKNQILIKTCLTFIIVFYIFLGLKNFGVFF
ncbi:MAG: manganese transporter [Flavobacteriaceae bacterium]|nr:manganese transporter [Flavobacteriaceae bacterium]|tara:strand:+ start:27775 stop:28974 length:1200 start_codon:yes stop_codon:yes gene_type:complete